MKKIITKGCCVLAGLFFSYSLNAAEVVDWQQQGKQAIEQALSVQPNTKTAKNIILFVGDGMGVATVTAARIYAGQLQGMAGEEHQLNFERLPYTALSKTYNTNQQTSDSAGTMSAMMTGWKTKAGFISVGEEPKRGECEKAKNHFLPTFLEQAEQAGLSTGVVTTARVTHATPAATYAHSPERYWEDDSQMPAQAIKEGCLDIAAQLIEFSIGDGVDVVLGGGRRSFFSEGGRRTDSRNLVDEWLQKYPQSVYVENKAQLARIDVAKTKKVLGLFNKKHMTYSLKAKKKNSAEPSLVDMTEQAIAILSKNQKGFFLMVEGGRIDHGHHGNHAKKALSETVVFDRAISKAMSMVDLEETLIIVTADHSHVMTMAGYPTRGNPILGKMIVNDRYGEPLKTPYLADDGKPWTSLSYANGSSAMANREDLSAVDTEADNYRQQAFIALGDETHGGEDVAIYATGPWAHLVRGVQEQNYIYHVMRHAAQLESR